VAGCRFDVFKATGMPKRCQQLSSARFYFVKHAKKACVMQGTRGRHWMDEQLSWAR